MKRALWVGMLGFGVVLGATLTSANALPSASIGYGQNPLVSIGGTTYDGETKVLFTAPADQDIIIKDIVLTSSSNMTCKRAHKSEFILGSGAVLGQFETSSASSNGSYGMAGGISVQHSFASGLRVPAGDTLTFMVTQSATNGSSCGGNTVYGVRYMVAGYYAQM
jgi:hypothetical protein